MTKGYVTFVQQLYSQILSDLGDQLPELRKEFSRDYTRLCSALEKRGLPFFTIDLVDMGKHFDYCLSQSRLTRFVGPHTRPFKKGSPIPRLFRGLVRRVFQDSGELATTCDTLAVRALRQLYNAAKKLKLECENERTFKTVREFYQVDYSLPYPSLDWNAGEFNSGCSGCLQFGDNHATRTERAQYFLPDIVRDTVGELPPSTIRSLHFVCDLVVAEIGVYDPYRWPGRHGPGAVSDQQKGVSKYEFPNWPGRLERVFPLSEFAFANLGLWADFAANEECSQGLRVGTGSLPVSTPSSEGSLRVSPRNDLFTEASSDASEHLSTDAHFVPGIRRVTNPLGQRGPEGVRVRFEDREVSSLLHAVPKTQKTPRLICAEPICNQWAQQSIKAFLYSRVSRTFIGNAVKFNDQRFSQRAAKRASILSDHWTIDLSSASDRVSCWLVERVFRRNQSLLDSFYASRTRLIRNGIDQKSPRLYIPRKFSCMGSALTFPIQSLIFFCVCVSALIDRRGLDYTKENVVAMSRQVLVFGDDLIVPEDVGPLVVGMLRYLYLEVNRTKTFGKGNFRESCGGEYFKGHDVTPTYLLSYPRRQRPESVISTVATRNNFFRSGYMRVAEYLKSTVIREAKVLLPSLPIGSGRLCWETFGEVILDGLRTRLDKNTHQRHIYAHDVTAVVRKGPDRYDSRLLQYFTEAPPPDTRWESGVPLRPKFNLKLRWAPLA